MSTLLDDAVHLWYLDEQDADDRQTEAYLRLLNDDERERHGRFRCDSAQRQFLLARGLLRTTLSRYVDVPPTSWTFQLNSHGKPSVLSPDCHDIRFNISHTKGMVCCAVTRACDVGVDVEWLERNINLGIADRYFAPPEVAQLNDVPDQDRKRVFLRFWTLKEAYIKARGLGLAIPLSDFWFDLFENQPPNISISPAQNDPPERWRFFEQELVSKHRVAVAVESRNGRFPDVVCNPWEVFAT